VSAERIADLIDPALRGLGVRGRVREEQLRLALDEIVGVTLAPMCRAERLDRGALLIATANSALAHQLQMDAPRLINALNARLGAAAVRRLRFTAL
jgi:hypothetical protein